MHYVLAVLTFIFVSFGLIVLHVFMLPSVGFALGKYLEVLISFFVARWVFLKLKPKSEKVKVKSSTDGSVEYVNHQMDKYEIKDFTKVFTTDVMNSLNIDEVFITNAVKEKDYVIHIRSIDYRNVDQEGLRKKLSKRFYNVEGIELLEYNKENVQPEFLRITK